MNAIVNALSAENERERKSSADLAETPRLQENLRKLVTNLRAAKLIDLSECPHKQFWGPINNLS